jgi:hypothetical protein
MTLAVSSGAAFGVVAFAKGFESGKDGLEIAAARGEQIRSVGFSE